MSAVWSPKLQLWEIIFNTNPCSYLSQPITTIVSQNFANQSIAKLLQEGCLRYPSG
jgi:hypothetical protein